MSSLKNDRFLKALARQPVDVTPVWIMRQAGRYLPEYRKTRESAGSFMTLCKTPELACEVTLQPLRRYELDASIIFSDILTIPDAMGLGLEFIEGKGPVFARLIQDENAVRALRIPDPEKLSYVYDAIRLTKQEIAGSVPLIGFCGSPWTLAAYMVEGQSKSGFPTILHMLETNPQLLHNLLDILSKSVAAHLQAQIDAGADAVMLFDTWGGILTTEKYQQFSLRYLQQIINQIQANSNYNIKKVPIILFTKGGGRWLSDMADTGCDALGLDWETSLTTARKQVGERVALQGNLDPACLLTNPDNIRREVARVLNEFGPGNGHVFNLGHGITPDVPPENVTVLVEAVHEFSKPYHARNHN